MGTDKSPGNPCRGRDVRPRSLKATYQELEQENHSCSTGES